MDTLTNKNVSETENTGNIAKAVNSALGIIMWLIGFDTLTKEEKRQSGIDLSGEGRDE